jgi:ABC-type branched-subunit amino acid transport system ATPase component
VTLLVADGLVKSFGGVHAVREVGFRLERGERLAVIGPNGAGKSTLFATIGGQLRPDGGRVHLDGRDVTGLAAHRLARAGVARTFQVAATFLSMSVAENVQLALLSRQRRHFGLWRAARFKERIPAMALLERLGMAEQADRPAGVLAYGDVKRLELALALALEPELLLMDEPTAGMAAEERHALMALAGELVAERGLGLLFTEHDMDVVFAHADRVLVLARGEVLAEGPPAAIRADREVRALYLGQGFGEAA